MGTLLKVILQKTQCVNVKVPESGSVLILGSEFFLPYARYSGNKNNLVIRRENEDKTC